MTSCMVWWQGCDVTHVFLENCTDLFMNFIKNILLWVQWCWFSKTQWSNTSRWHCTPNYHWLCKLNTGLQVTWAMSFSTLPPDSMTLVSHLKRGFWTTGQQSSSLLLSPGKTALRTTVVKFLDTSVCGALDALTPASVHSLWSSPKILESILLDNPHKACGSLG